VRKGAFFLDGLACCVIQALLQYPLYAAGLRGLVGFGTAGLLGVLVSAAYFVVFPLRWEGATPGKLAARIAVRRMDGEPLSTGCLLLRWAGYWVSMLPCGLGYCFPAFTRDKRALHDFMAETEVVYTAPAGPLRLGAVILSPMVFILLLMGLAAHSVLSGEGFKGSIETRTQNLVQGGVRVMEQGWSFGPAAGEGGCLDEALIRLHSCSGFRCQIEHKLFLKACLEAAGRTAAFCEGVPAPESLLGTVGWSIGRCTDQGFSDPQACSRVLREVQTHCRAPVQQAGT